MAGVAAAAVIAVAIPAGLGAFGQPPRPEQPPAAPTLYIYGSDYNYGYGSDVGSAANRANVVTPVNTATNKSGKPIHVGVGGTWPGGMIVITPDGKTAYIATTSGTITPINTATGTPGKPIHIHGRNEQNRPDFIAITPDGKTAYVVSQNECGIGDYRCPYTVTPVSTATGTPGKPIHVGGFGPYWFGGEIAITPDGKTAYVNTGSGVTPINIATGTPGKPIHVPGGAIGGIAITP